MEEDERGKREVGVGEKFVRQRRLEMVKRTHVTL